MVSSEEESEMKTHDNLEWDVDMEIQLFYAMANHKPVGIKKHFHMVGIWEKLTNSITKEISTQDIWKHLDTLYDMAMLEDTEPIPFPNNEVVFNLPEQDFGPLIKQKCKEAILADDSDGDGRSPSPKTATSRSNSRGNAKDGTTKDRRRDSRDSNASGPRESTTSRKSVPQRDKTTKSKVTSVAAWDSPLIDEDSSTRRGRRRANTSTPPATVPAKRRRT
ncbi:PREDICTED: MRG/MORF4L-binding protein isoform X3 [Papilio xuthus]|uniref:MRG/MORF4L-binding protein isoform X3 n=1 Tax=Papilio xuthus TaxID=66420 RepID=A0AAJ6ZK60_PAPXU|nr:PREDICTED: MRG/MORF4L-binding protein isoform X3 [Papilio xuthus]